MNREPSRPWDDVLEVVTYELRNAIARLRNAAHILGSVVPGERRLDQARVAIDRVVAPVTKLVAELVDVVRVLPQDDAQKTMAPNRILIVDDDADATEALMMLLSDAGHDVRTAQDGESALAEARIFWPQLMFVDIGLPGMSGYDLARALRRTPGLEAAVLVAVTGHGLDEDRSASRAAGFDDHWVKPIDLERLSTFAARPPS